MFNAINGISCLGLFLCSDLETNSFPVPDSPCIRTVALVLASLPIDLKTICIEGAEPIISALGIFFGLASLCSSRAFWIVITASSRSNGFGIYSKAPPPYESIAACISVKAVMIITGNFS